MILTMITDCQMTNDDILDIRRRALEEAAQVAWEAAEKNRVTALKLRIRSNNQAKQYDGDIANQTMISAQALDACAEEARLIYSRILALRTGLPERMP